MSDEEVPVWDQAWDYHALFGYDDRPPTLDELDELAQRYGNDGTQDEPIDPALTLATPPKSHTVDRDSLARVSDDCGAVTALLADSSPEGSSVSRDKTCITTASADNLEVEAFFHILPPTQKPVTAPSLAGLDPAPSLPLPLQGQAPESEGQQSWGPGEAALSGPSNRPSNCASPNNPGLKRRESLSWQDIAPATRHRNDWTQDGRPDLLASTVLALNEGNELTQDLVEGVSKDVFIKRSNSDDAGSDDESFVGHFSSLREARQYKSDHLQQTLPFDPSIPRTAPAEMEVVKNLYSAMSNTTGTNDTAGRAPGQKPPLAWNNFVNGKYSDQAIQATCWEIMERCKVKATCGDLVPKDQHSRGSVQCGSYAELIEALCETLKVQKTICKRLMDIPFMDDIIDNPVGQLKRATQNKRLNTHKAKQIQEGRKALAQTDTASRRRPAKSETAKVKVDDRASGTAIHTSYATTKANNDEGGGSHASGIQARATVSAGGTAQTPLVQAQDVWRSPRNETFTDMDWESSPLVSHAGQPQWPPTPAHSNPASGLTPGEFSCVDPRLLVRSHSLAFTPDAIPGSMLGVNPTWATVGQQGVFSLGAGVANDVGDLPATPQADQSQKSPDGGPGQQGAQTKQKHGGRASFCLATTPESPTPGRIAGEVGQRPTKKRPRTNDESDGSQNDVARKVQRRE